MADGMNANELLRQLRQATPDTEATKTPRTNPVTEQDQTSKVPEVHGTPVESEPKAQPVQEVASTSPVQEQPTDHSATSREKELIARIESEKQLRKAAEAELAEVKKEPSVIPDRPKKTTPDEVNRHVDEVVNNTALLDTVSLPKASASGPSTTLAEFQFGDMFVKNENGYIVSQKGRDVTIKRVQEALLVQAIDDVKKRYVGTTIRVGAFIYTISDNNRVFTAQVSFIRYSLLMNISEDLRVNLARQMFLSKYADGELPSFNLLSVKSDELDVYLMVLAATKATATSSDQLIERLALDVKKIKDTTTMTQNAINSNNKWIRRKLHALSHVVSWLFLERTALSKRQLPKSLDDIPTTVADIDIMKVTHIFDMIGDQQTNREATIQRTNRLKGAAPIRNNNKNNGPEI